MSALGSVSSWGLGLLGGALITIALGVPYVLTTTGKATEQRLLPLQALSIYVLALLPAAAAAPIASTIF